MTESRDNTYRVDEGDPIARLVTDRLERGWASVLIIVFVLYGPVEKWLIPTIGGYLHLFGFPVRTWVPDVEALLTGFVEFPFFFAYYIWSGRGVGSVFETLESTRVFSDAEGYRRFWERARAWFVHPGWAALGALVAVGLMLFWHFSLWGPKAPVPPWFEIHWVGDLETGRFVHEYGSHPFARGLSIVLIGIVGYALVQILVREILALVWLSLLWHELGAAFVVHPYHPDNAGGVGAIGRHALHLSMFLLFALLFIVMASMLPSLRAGVASNLFWDGALVFGWLAYVVFVALTIGPLVVWPHQQMSRARDARVAVVSERLDALLEQQHAALNSNTVELESVTKQIEELKKVRSQLMQDFPVWPFTVELRVQLGLSSMPALLLPVVKFLLTEGYARLSSLLPGVKS